MCHPAQASAVSEEILKTEYDSVRLLYNSFKSAISFKPTISTILSPETLEKSDIIADRFDQYELEGTDRAEMLADLAEFQLASMMYYAMNEACTTEHASRMQVRRRLRLVPCMTLPGRMGQSQCAPSCALKARHLMQAMESSTKNSSEMMEKLTLMFNRTRQAKITTELNEIISGALSLEDAKK
jgi:F-type H+-transporting ATPase subunit gamma